MDVLFSILSLNDDYMKLRKDYFDFDVIANAMMMS